ncbi:mevalonate kinase [Legionella steigerwaltii]|uniref:Mevalonate kinase n=1 Tax=Legionella steigerwaltii TaxID=460 RepID=A0A378L854_9GAMM|nr:mevalonate kinase [Legionella steigerwaltii]KTD80630.1 mevalonate kinase [Legionella steigerwaltii]STY22530.1 mevalonate kinase [Legionella steigerwaltii]
MTFFDFETTTFGKWILAGEHAVVRGHPALVFPIKEKKLTLSYSAAETSLGADYTGSSGADMHLLFWSVLEHGMQLLGRSLNQIGGYFHLDSTIPVGAGMGASAALCVAMSRWFCAQNLIDLNQCNDFAKELEHLFHGKSSGLDVAGVAAERGVYFKAGSIVPLQQKIYPKFFLSSCKQIGITSHCIHQVQNLWTNDPALAQHIDKQMVDAVEKARNALEQGGADAITSLAKAINKAADCFYQWNLVSESLQQHMNRLIAEGALAVKPTGSGGGGFVLSLWDKQPSEHLELLTA